MTPAFSNLIKSMKSIAIEEFIGYEEWEIEKIERLYDIKVTGDFKDFLLVAGRSSGGAIGDYEVVLYWHESVRDHILFQQGNKDDLEEIGRLDTIVSRRPFFFSVSTENEYYFFNTWDDDGDQCIYVYDEIAEDVRKTGFTFVSYMERQVLKELDLRQLKLTDTYLFSKEIVVCKGELLNI